MNFLSDIYTKFNLPNPSDCWHYLVKFGTDEVVNFAIASAFVYLAVIAGTVFLARKVAPKLTEKYLENWSIFSHRIVVVGIVLILISIEIWLLGIVSDLAFASIYKEQC